MPIVPPTAERVVAMMSTVARAPDEVVGLLPPKQGSATIEKLAINAVMAGCLPTYFPVVLAAVEAMLDPRVDAFGASTSTSPGVPLLIINGPIRHELDINFSYCLMGPGKRANATIGRAISLIMLNIAGRTPGDICKSTHQQPGGYTMCFGEYEEKNPWGPLHVERGFEPAESTVTVIFPTGTVSILEHESTDPEDILTTIARSMDIIGSNNLYPYYGEGEMLLVLCPDHAAYLSRSLSKQQMKETLMVKTSKIPLSSLPKHRQKTIKDTAPQQLAGRFLRLANRPDQFIVVVAGGLGGYYSVFLPTMGPSYAVTRRIEASLTRSP